MHFDPAPFESRLFKAIYSIYIAINLKNDVDINFVCVAIYACIEFDYV